LGEQEERDLTVLHSLDQTSRIAPEVGGLRERYSSITEEEKRRKRSE